MQVVYCGPLEAVEIADTGQVAERFGEPVEVPDELGCRLLEQDVWARPEGAPVELPPIPDEADEAEAPEEGEA